MSDTTTEMKLTILGSGTSTGVPQLRCDCPVCRSSDPRDSRLRCSALLQTEGRDLLIDCGPDFRQQMLRYHRDGNLDALLLTHQHYDHVGGIDDLRPYCYYHREPRDFPVYCTREVARALRRSMPYSFAAKKYPGVPTYDIHDIIPYRPFLAAGIEVLPVPAIHSVDYNLQVIGFRVGELAYLTDVKTIAPEAVDALRGVKVLVINALRITEHRSHMSLAQALDVIERINPERACLTHISHSLGLHNDVSPTLPEGVFLAYDGLEITL